jgi:hypothetical protein
VSLIGSEIMLKTIFAVAATLLIISTVWLAAGELGAKNEAPHRAIVVIEGVHSREGVGQFAAISVVDRAKVEKLESFFPNYRKQPSSGIAAGWKTGASVYFDFGKGRVVRVTVSKNDDGKTWSVGNGDFKTHGNFDEYVRELRASVDDVPLDPGRGRSD